MLSRRPPSLILIMTVLVALVMGDRYEIVVLAMNWTRMMRMMKMSHPKRTEIVVVRVMTRTMKRKKNSL